MYKPLSKKDALKKYPVKLEFRFKNEEERGDFLAQYLDGNGEQSMEFCTELAEDDSGAISWHWQNPALFCYHYKPEEESE